MKILTALLAGLLFGVGLIVSGMANPSKVLGFLDLAGNWDPSLAFVMGGALLVGSIVFPFAARRSRSLLGEVMHLPSSTKIDGRLMLGGLTFGVGWGLAGYCPGPALVSLTYGGAKPWLFFVAMLAGMLLFEILERMQTKPRKQTA
ncbi:MAG TPA: YeeE/YedE family protein [Burkholderiaceae bacterium]|nr:YeeE/YedE family protein [Burkholderiaceae bacterium]